MELCREWLKGTPWEPLKQGHGTSALRLAVRSSGVRISSRGTDTQPSKGGSAGISTHPNLPSVRKRTSGIVWKTYVGSQGTCFQGREKLSELNKCLTCYNLVFCDPSIPSHLKPALSLMFSYIAGHGGDLPWPNQVAFCRCP